MFRIPLFSLKIHKSLRKSCLLRSDLMRARISSLSSKYFVIKFTTVIKYRVMPKICLFAIEIENVYNRFNIGVIQCAALGVCGNRPTAFIIYNPLITFAALLLLRTCRVVVCVPLYRNAEQAVGKRFCQL